MLLPRLSTHKNRFLIALLLFLAGPIQAQKLKPIVPSGHSGVINFAKYSHNGKYMQTISSEDNSIKIWEVKTGKMVYNLRETNTNLLFCEFSYDDRYLVTYSLFDTALKVWDISAEMIVHDMPVISDKEFLPSILFAVSPIENSICTSGDDSTAKIWDLVSSKCKVILKGHSADISALEYSSDGNTIFTTAKDGTVKIWEAATGKMLNSLTVIPPSLAKEQAVELLTYDPNKQLLLTIAGKEAVLWDPLQNKKLITLDTLPGEDPEMLETYFSKDGQYIIVRMRNQTGVWSAATGKLVYRVDDYTVFPLEKNYSSDGNFLVTAGHASKGISKIDIRDMQSGKKLLTIPAHSDSITSITFSPDNSRIITSSADQSAKVWDTSGDLIYTLQGIGTKNTALAISPNGTYFAAGNDKGGASICSVTGAERQYYLNGQKGSIHTVDISYDESLIITGAADNTVCIWDYRTGKRLHTLQHARDSLLGGYFSPKARYVLTLYEDSSARVWNARSGALQYHLKDVRTACFSSDDNYIVSINGHRNKVMVMLAKDGGLVLEKNLDYIEYDKPDFSNATFTPGDTVFITSSTDGVRRWNLRNGQLIDSILTKEGMSGGVFVQSIDGKHLLTYSFYGNNSAISVWDPAGKLHFAIPDSNHNIEDAAFSLDGQYVITYEDTYTMSIYRVSNGELLFRINDADGMHGRDELMSNELNLRNGVYKGMSKDSRYITVPSENNKIKIFEGQTGRLLYTFINLDSNDYLLQIPSIYYKATAGTSRQLHYATSDLRVINFEQLDIRFNRPDLVLRAIGNADTARINSYLHAYEKRVRRLGIDTTAFRDDLLVQECDFVNRDSIPQEQKKKELKLHIRARDSLVLLDRFNIWVNEAPLFGLKGISIKEAKSNFFDTTLTITLSEEINVIETSVRNVSGVETYRMPLQVRYRPARSPRRKTYFIGIGIDRFEDSSHNLSWSVSDIRNLAVSFKKKLGADMHVDTLFNEDVSVQNIKQMKQKLFASNVDDQVIVAYSGHGVLSKGYDYFLSTHAIDFNNPELAGLPYENLEDLLDSIPARKKLMLLDACHSGEVDKEEMEHYRKVKSRLKGLKGTILENTDSSRIGIKNSFELMQELFVNVRRSTGATVISAAAGTQFALEKNALKAGVFTYSILEYIQTHPTSTISALKKYVNKRVSELTEGLQQPTARTENLNHDWKLW